MIGFKKFPQPTLATAVLCGLLAGPPMAGPAAALTLALPDTASITGQQQAGPTSYRMPVGPFRDGFLPTRTKEGMLQQSAWRIATPGLTTLQVLAPLREQILQGGYRILYECEAVECGGFDFRYGTDVLPEPDMHVDLGDFRYLAAEQVTPSGSSALTLLISRSADQSFVQLTQVLPEDAQTAAQVTTVTAPADTGAGAITTGTQTGDIGAALENAGAMALDDLVFASGAATLEPGDYVSLRDLARWLQADPGRQVALVGHTDASGGLDANMALSLRRAASVRDRLVATMGAPAAQVVAQGVGPLSPRTGNLTPEGRERNRRVEVVLLTPP